MSMDPNTRERLPSFEEGRVIPERLELRATVMICSDDEVSYYLPELPSGSVSGLGSMERNELSQSQDSHHQLIDLRQDLGLGPPEPTLRQNVLCGFLLRVRPDHDRELLGSIVGTAP